MFFKLCYDKCADLNCRVQSRIKKHLFNFPKKPDRLARWVAALRCRWKSAVTDRRGAFIGWRSAVIERRGAVTDRKRAVTDRRSAVTVRRSEVTDRRGAVTGRRSAATDRRGAVTGELLLLFVPPAAIAA